MQFNPVTSGGHKILRSSKALHDRVVGTFLRAVNLLVCVIPFRIVLCQSVKTINRHVLKYQPVVLGGVSSCHVPSVELCSMATAIREGYGRLDRARENNYRLVFLFFFPADDDKDNIRCCHSHLRTGATILMSL